MAPRLFGRPLWAAPRETQPSDEVGRALILRWRSGDAEAFNDLFKTYRSLVYGVLHHLLPHDPEIEDVVQSAFIEIFRSLGSFEGRSKLSSWIARVALHVGYHHLRRRKSRPPDYEADHGVPEHLVDDRMGANPDVAMEQQDAIRRVYGILDTIAERKRTVFVLNDLQGVPQEEVAEIVGANIATVRTRLFYARKEFWKKAAEDPVLAKLVEGDRLPGVTSSRNVACSARREDPDPARRESIASGSKLTSQAGRHDDAGGGEDD